LDRYYSLGNIYPSSEWQCGYSCGEKGISFDYSVRLDVDKTIVNDVPAASGARGNRDITFRLEVSNLADSDVLVNNPVLTDVLGDICGASHIVQLVSPPTIVSSTALANPNLNPGYDGINDADIFDNNSGTIQPGESITIEYTVEFEDPCYGVNWAYLGGEDPFRKCYYY